MLVLEAFLYNFFLLNYIFSHLSIVLVCVHACAISFLYFGEDCISKNLIYLYIFHFISLLVKNVLCALLKSAFCLKGSKYCSKIEDQIW